MKIRKLQELHVTRVQGHADLPHRCNVSICAHCCHAWFPLSLACSNTLLVLSLQLSSLLTRLLGICCSVSPHLSQFLCSFAREEARVFSFDFWTILRIKPGKGRRRPLGYIGIFELLFCFLFRRDMNFNFFFMTGLVCLPLPCLRMSLSLEQTRSSTSLHTS